MLHGYLYFGYRPTWDKTTADWLIRLTPDLAHVDGETGPLPQEDLERLALHALRSSMAAEFERNASADIHVVPLSGGLDSRAVLAGLLDLDIRDKIHTVTFGIPGAWDYDLAREVARVAGVKHEAIDLTSIQLSLADLVDTVKSGGKWTYTIDAFYNGIIRKRYGTDAVYWSGFQGDALTGAHLAPSRPIAWDTAIHHFLNTNRYCWSVPLLPECIEPTELLPDQPLVQASRLDYDDQLDLGIRQLSGIMPIVISSRYRQALPFLQEAWTRFILGIPREFRHRQRLYKRVLHRAWPEIFSVPIKNHYGARIDASRLRISANALSFKLVRRFASRFGWPSSAMRLAQNYIDVADAFRNRPDYRRLLVESVSALRDYDLIPWVPIDRICNEHRRGVRNHSQALLLFCGLAANHIAERSQEAS